MLNATLPALFFAASRKVKLLSDNTPFDAVIEKFNKLPTELTNHPFFKKTNTMPPFEDCFVAHVDKGPQKGFYGFL